MSKASLPYQPRLLGAPEAAAYIGVSQSTLRDLGIPRRKLLGRRLYDRIDLDAYASGLPYEGEDSTDEVAAWDARLSG